MSRRPPAAVRRELRQEVNFGCAICGAPILQYHHIVPYSEEEHHDPDRMVALCPNHHQQAGPQGAAISRDRLYEHKESPANRTITDYEFYFDSGTPQITFGGMNCILEDAEEMVLLEVDYLPLVSMSYIDGILSFDCCLYNPSNELIAGVNENEWWADPRSVWDLQYQPNRFKVWHGPRDIGLEVTYDHDSDQISIRGNLYYNGEEIRATPSKINIGGNRIVGGAVIDISTAISYKTRRI
jgi:hypothetical protein